MRKLKAGDKVLIVDKSLLSTWVLKQNRIVTIGWPPSCSLEMRTMKNLVIPRSEDGHGVYLYKFGDNSYMVQYVGKTRKTHPDWW